MSLKRRVDRLAARLTPPPPPEPFVSPEDEALMLEMLNRWYGDPVRWAKRIELIEQCKRDLAERERAGLCRKS